MLPILACREQYRIRQSPPQELKQIRERINFYLKINSLALYINYKNCVIMPNTYLSKSPTLKEKLHPKLNHSKAPFSELKDVHSCNLKKCTLHAISSYSRKEFSQKINLIRLL